MTTTGPEPDLGELLMRATRGLRRRWATSLEPWDLSPHHARALQVVGELEGPRLGAIADRLRIAPRSTTEVIDTLADRGLVERVADDSDRRAICVVLTTAGRDLLADVRAARTADAAVHFSALDADERAQLAQLLARLDERPHDR